MRAMILAAGRGERMRPLTDTLPKPLLPVGGHALIVWHLHALARAGFQDVVINHAWLGERLVEALGDGSRWGLRLHYSAEGERGLETAAGIARALPVLGEAPFLVLNGDVWCDWQPAAARAVAQTLDGQAHQAWLLMVDNPTHHPTGDFSRRPDGVLHPKQAGDTALTYAGIGVFHPALFHGVSPDTPSALAPLLRQAMTHDQVSGERHEGHWTDVGTPERLQTLDQWLVHAGRQP